jgi:methylenetetrahydrofolate dehydrogenase (NADP+)/methenyltetrahydrofolate cyclohydrolase
VQQILIRNGIETKGANAVIVGRSNIVGKPMANLLIQTGPGGDATVTVCHSKTRDLPAVTRTADILIAAIGKAEFVTADMVRPGAVVIDVGINRVDDASRPRGYRLTGDVDYAPVAEIASAITPVPGGVGPMTIAMLLMNTLQAMRQMGAD